MQYRLTGTAIVAFIPIWLGTALLNMSMGVARAPHSVGEKFPLVLVIFSIPAGVALFIW